MELIVRHIVTMSKGYIVTESQCHNVVVAGLVHSVPSPLYSLGSRVSEGARQFVETGATDKMEMETVNKTFLDAVLAPPIMSGVGETNTTIFVDSNHTKVLQSLSDLIMM